MKLADRTVEVHSAGISASNQFSIAQTSKMFKILSDSLYSDKVMAVIRELATNAYDSHISAGNKNPFLVKLPTAADPNFTVRDYGTGLSQKDMEHLYTTYGASNKNDSNDFVGCLGLGSKSPFAYTKSFTTTSYFDGTQYTYIAAIDDSGVPTLNLIHSCETDQPNGLEISFAVKQYDFTEFSQKSIRVFHYFRMKPIITGGVNWDFSKAYDNKNIVISGDGWRVCRLNNDNTLFPNHHHRINSGVISIMGNIAYPVETEHLVGEEKAHEVPDHIARWNRAFNKADIASWKSFIGEIIDQGLYLELDFGIGELEMDVSREGLQYTKSVVKSLRKKTQEIFAELKDMFSEKIAEAKTKVEAISTYYQLNDLAGGWGVGASWTDSKGKTHNITSGSDLEYKFKKSKNLYVFNYRTAGYRSRRMIYLTDRIHHDTLTGKGQGYWNNSRKNGQLTFFYCDIAATETAKKIVTKYCNQNDCFAYLLVDTDDHKDVTNGFDDLVADVGSDKILNVSDYRDLIKNTSPRKVGTKGSKGSVSDQDVFLIVGDHANTSPLTIEYNSSAHMRSMSSKRLDEFLEEDTIVYIPILRYASTTGYPSVSEVEKYFASEYMNRIPDFLDGTNIYAIKHNFVHKLTVEGYNLVDFNTWMKNRLKHYNKNKFAELIKFNAMVEKCKKELATNDSTSNDYYGRGNIDKTVLFHMLNIFGLEYGEHIQNKEIVKCLDSLMIMEFFADTIHREKFDMSRFSQTDYYGLITRLLSDIGINGLNSKEIKTMNVAYNTLSHMLTTFYNRYDDNGTLDDKDKYMNLIKVDAGDIYKMPSMDSIRNTLKVEIDKNPVLKYIIASVSVDGNLRELSKNPNPLKQIEGNGRYRHYGNSGRETWYQKLDDVESFKQQLSSTIK